MEEIMMPSKILSLWPSLRAIERDIGVPQQTVGSWSTNETIPAGYWWDLVASAQKRGIPGITFDLLARSVATVQQERVRERIRKRREKQQS